MSALEQNSLILVTGANGFIATHVIETCLAAGYRVRGTARSADKMANLQATWTQKYGEGKFEVAVVPNIERPGAFDEALKGKSAQRDALYTHADATGTLCAIGHPGVSGVAHLATITGFSIIPEQVIDPVVNAALNVLRSCAAHPSVKSVVFTSSSVAASWFTPETEFDIGEDSWNDASVENAHSLPDDEPTKPWHIYAASKVLAERAAWNFYKETNPGFVFNTVLPSFTLGPMFEPEVSVSTASWLKKAFLGDWSAMMHVPPHVRDVARLHLRALNAPELAAGGARMMAAAGPFNVNEVLSSLRTIYPQKTFREDFTPMVRDLSKIDNKRGTALLGGWRSLEEAVKANTEHL
ncbi:hypothetical protein HWV62_9743 [Athelia sp. TMB]|nr:hypothetical protein HWV62_9743 [Athelia sp. TMB]